MNNSIKNREEMMRVIFIISFIALVFFSFSIFYLTGNFIHIMLIWNILLSFFPLYISKKLSKKKSIGNILLWFMWFLFIPNAFYMITDFIHIQQIQFIAIDSPYHFTWIQNIDIWLELINIVLCISIGVAMGIKSMDYTHKLVGNKHYFLFLPVISILIGFAIYIGRFLRFNSWDILQPFTLLQKLSYSIDVFAIQFISLFAILILFVNLLYYFIKNCFFMDKPLK